MLEGAATRTDGLDAQAPLVFMYSGQGSQYFGMGRELFEREPVFRRSMRRCSELIEPWLGRSLVDVVYDARRRRAEPFTEILCTHPAVFAFQWSFTQVLLERGVRPGVLLGYSIGELVAATVAHAVSLEDALRLTVDQARLLEERGVEGGMAAILHPLGTREVHRELFAGCDVAAMNGRAHFVVAGPSAAVRRLRAGLTGARMICEVLPVRFAFHSALMDPLEPAFMQMAAAMTFGSFEVPVVSCAYGDFLDRASPDYLWHLVRWPVRFDRAVARLEDRGPHVYVDLGPSGTLANFVKNNLDEHSRSVVAPSLTPFGRESASLERLLSVVRREPDAAALRGRP